MVLTQSSVSFSKLSWACLVIRSLVEEDLVAVDMLSTCLTGEKGEFVVFVRGNLPSALLFTYYCVLCNYYNNFW